MNVEATTKAYHMEVKKGKSVMEGVYTGHIRQKVHEWMFTVPIQATYSLGEKVTLKAGPYMSLVYMLYYDYQLNPEDTNSIDNPRNIVPKESTQKVGKQFPITLAPYSITVIEMN